MFQRFTHNVFRIFVKEIWVRHRFTKPMTIHKWTDRRKIKLNNLNNYLIYWCWLIVTFFLLIIWGPSSLTLSPLGAQVFNLFLHISSHRSRSSAVPDNPTDSRRVKVKEDLTNSEVDSLPLPTMESIWLMLQWDAMLHVFSPFRMCDLWLDHLGLMWVVFPTYINPQGQDKE